MKLSIAGNGAWLATDDKNDVHIYADKTHVEIATNDANVFADKGYCPLALSLENGKATLQVAHKKDVKHYDIPLEVVDVRLRKFLSELVADFAK